jgi:guanosine-3',5'-bis(diphosphate) 3'-pyrophosphohydrolase
VSKDKGSRSFISPANRAYKLQKLGSVETVISEVSSADCGKLGQICEALKKYYPDPDLPHVIEAYGFAKAAHSPQRRVSGEPFFNHVEETTLLVCSLKLDAASVIAALLHDTIEDTGVTREDIASRFGEDVAHIVDGVTKLTRIEFSSREVKQAESFRKMLIAMAKDIRVVLVKLCDRLHNMRTLGELAPEKRLRIANETKDIYAPIANRLGIHWLKSELEDLCFLHIRPELFSSINAEFDRTAPEREQYIKQTGEKISSFLENSGITASVTGRVKHAYSVWQKMERQNLAFNEIHDLLGFRIIVPTVRACYETLGIIHASWRPVPGRFKDYIAMPKPNMYQSLHTTVIGPEGHRVEIQIRTPEMHRVAEDGIAAHWRYKERGESITEGEFDLRWVKDLVESQAYLKNPDEFIQSVKSELFPEEVFVFTPKGDLFRLPYNATPIDFAYAVHTDVGHRTIGAKANGQIVPLDYQLQNGDTVEILTSKQHIPSKDWLRFVQSSKAKQRIRAFLKHQERTSSLALGLELLTKDMRKLKLSLRKLEKSGKVLEVAKELGLKSEDDLYAELGYGKLTPSKVLARFLPDGSPITAPLVSDVSPLERIFQRAARTSRKRVGVRVSGVEDVIVRFARCCEPLPGDRIVGFITRGRGVTVHNADCMQVHQSDPLRLVEVTWEQEVDALRKVRLTVHAQDMLGLLAGLSSAITSQGANISGCSCKTSNIGKATVTFELHIKDAGQLSRVRRAIEQVSGVTKVERVTHFMSTLNLDRE